MKHWLSAVGKENIPFVDDLLLLLVWLNEPLADANEATVHETALQQVVNGFEEERPTLIGQAAVPLAILLTLKQTNVLNYTTTTKLLCKADCLTLPVNT